MTQEEKQLLIKDISARLSYKVMIYFHTSSTIQGSAIVLNSDIYGFIEDALNNSPYEIKEIKPYLRPMSSMTEEERKEYESFFSIGEYACGGSLYGEEYEYIADDYDDVTQSVFLIDWLNAHHFDYRGLIKKGLALEAKEGMYKN